MITVQEARELAASAQQQEFFFDEGFFNHMLKIMESRIRMAATRGYQSIILPPVQKEYKDRVVETLNENGFKVIDEQNMFGPEGRVRLNVSWLEEPVTTTESE